MDRPAPHDAPAPTLTTRRGGFWITGELVDSPAGRAQRGPMWVEWEAPAEPTHPLPLILVHGGGGQGTDWLVTPDGRPGWARDLVAAGFIVYVVDRPGHGRSPHHPDVLGVPAAQGSLEMTRAIFAPDPFAAEQTQWPWSREADGPEISQLVASSGFLLADLAEANALDGARLGSLLEQVGPAVLITHSLGALGGWVAAAQRPDLVSALVAIEPMGPPFAEIPGLGALTEGLTATPLTAPGAVSSNDAPLAGVPIAIVTGSASPLAAVAPAVGEFLEGLGAEVELLPLGADGIVGNGHGLTFEANSAESAARVVEWIRSRE